LDFLSLEPAWQQFLNAFEEFTGEA
jgi:hypothetical protein